MSSKLEVLNKLINKTVIVKEGNDEWVGEVVSIKDEYTVMVKEENILHEVSLFDIIKTR